MMKFDILTLFPEMFEPLKQSIIGRAIEKNLIKINLINIRDFSRDKHKKVDDTPFGGGAGMVMKADVVYLAYKSVEDSNAKVIYMSPKGKKLNQKKVQELSNEEHLIILCGHYEGIDQRVIDKIVDEEISIRRLCFNWRGASSSSINRQCFKIYRGSFVQRVYSRRIIFKWTFRISTIYKT